MENKTPVADRKKLMEEMAANHEKAVKLAHDLISSKEFQAFDSHEFLRQPEAILDTLLRLDRQESDPVNYAFTVSKLLNRYALFIEIRNGVRKADDRKEEK